MSDEERRSNHPLSGSSALQDRVEQLDAAVSVHDLPEILEIDYEAGSESARAASEKKARSTAYISAIKKESSSVSVCPKIEEGLVSAEREQGRVHSELEWYIEARTAQLRTFNELLRREREERIRAEEALRALEARFRVAAQCASELIYEWDFSNDHIEWYGDIDGALGYEPGEFPRTFEAWEQAIHSEDHDSVICAVKDHILQEKPFRVQYRIRCKDGSYAHWSGRGVALCDEEGNPQSWIGASRDVTREMQMQLRLCEARKMEAMTTLAAGLSKDFTNILGVVSGYTDIALLQPHGNEIISKSLLKVKRACNRARDLVRQMLIFSTPNMDERRSIQIGPVVEETLKRFETSLSPAIEVEQDIKSGSDFVLASRAQIRQILLNLCTNAVRSMKTSGGVLRVFLDTITFLPGDLRPHPDLVPGSYVLLTVKDTGQGMDARTLERIFEPYFTTNEKSEGRGLGLSIVHGLVRSYGGAITATSVHGCGSTFDVYLPQIEAVQEETKESRRQLPGGNERILVVDDNRQILDVSCRMLEYLGYKVRGVTSCTDALRLIQTEPEGFDLIVADHAMPRMSGTELAKRLHGISSRVPVILTLECGKEVESEESGRAGVSKFISKPLEMDELSKTVRQVLDQTAAGKEAKDDDAPELVIRLQLRVEPNPLE